MILHTRALVDIHNSNFQFLSEEIYSVRALSEERATYSIFCRVNKFYGLYIIIHLLESDDWSKELLCLRSHSIICIHNYCRLKESSQSLLVCVLVSTNNHLSAHINCILAYLHQLLHVFQYRHWSNVCVLVHWVTHFQLLEDFL